MANSGLGAASNCNGKPDPVNNSARGKIYC